MAIEFFEKAIDLDPTIAASWYGKGRVYYKLGQYELAIESFEKAIDLDPTIAAPWNGKGMVHYSLGQYELAIENFEKAIDLDPTDTDAWYGKGIIYIELGQYELAIESFEKAIDLDPTIAYPWNGKGAVYLKVHQVGLAQRCFLRGLLLQMDHLILQNYLETWVTNPRHPFFLQDVFGLQSGSQNTTLFVQEQVASMCRVINFFLKFLEETEAFREIPSSHWTQFQALINYFMGHPFKSFRLFEKEVLPQSPNNLQAYYYLIRSCYEFLENEEPYLEKAVSIAEQFHQVLEKKKQKGIGGLMGRTVIVLPSKEEIIQRYYAALIFEMDTDVESALQCITPIWDKTDFLPISYLYYHLLFKQQKELIQPENQENETEKVWTETDKLKILIKDPFPKIGRYILSKEAKAASDQSFAFGFPLHEIDPKEEKWWEPFYHYAHYYEITDAINLLEIQVRSHFNNRDVVPGDALKPLWECFSIDSTDIIFMQETMRKKAREKVGLKFLKAAEQHLKGASGKINTNPEQLEQSIKYVLFERGDTKEPAKRAYDELKKTSGSTPNALVNRIASKIEAYELGNDFDTYHYLITYFLLTGELTERESVFLQFYAFYAQAFRNKAIPAIVQGGIKDQFKDIVGSGYDWATTIATGTNPVVGLTMAAFKPFVKGSMGELFVGLLKQGNHKTMMRYNVPVYDSTPGFEKVLLAPSFKEAFLEFVGKEKERLGEKFEKVYPMYEFEEWIEEQHEDG